MAQEARATSAGSGLELDLRAVGCALAASGRGDRDRRLALLARDVPAVALLELELHAGRHPGRQVAAGRLGLELVAAGLSLGTSVEVAVLGARDGGAELG